MQLHYARMIESVCRCINIPTALVCPTCLRVLHLCSASLCSRNPTMLDVLHWVMFNTVAAMKDGIREWAANGFHFVSTFGQPLARSRLPEKLELAEFYGPAMQPLTDIDAVLLAESHSCRSRL